MQYQITSDNIDLSPSMNELAKEKFQRIEKRIDSSIDGDCCFARVVMNSAPEGTFTVKSTVNLDGKEYFSDETDFTLESALISTVEEIVQMMEKDKEIQRRKALKDKEALHEEELQGEEEMLQDQE